MGTLSRQVQIVLLCEDTQHEVFARRFLVAAGLGDPRRLRVEKAPRGHGAAEQFVRQRFPSELVEHRRTAASMAQVLIVILDGDNVGVDGRQTALDQECLAAGIETRRDDESVLVVVPTWNIETWIAYLDGQTVDETRPDYPRLNRERECQPRVVSLVAMCRNGELRIPAPTSLEAACTEYMRIAR